MFKKYALPDLDDPATSAAHREIILRKPILKKWYAGWYRKFKALVSTGPEGPLLELGSGGGFMKKEYPEVITSDIMPVPGVEKVIDAEKLPFANSELAGIFMLNVFHHIPDPEKFLSEAERTLKSGGKIMMVEPANTALSRFIYKRFHHEPFDEHGARQIKAGNPLSNSNQAMAYIYFERDRKIFENKYPGMHVNSIVCHTPFTYLISGGVSRSAMLPGFFYPLIQFGEWLLSPFSRILGLFCTVVIERK